MVWRCRRGSARSAYACGRSRAGTNRCRGTLAIASSTRGCRIPRGRRCSSSIRVRSRPYGSRIGAWYPRRGAGASRRPSAPPSHARGATVRSPAPGRMALAPERFSSGAQAEIRLRADRTGPNAYLKFCGARSSAGQSSGLIIRRSQVRILAGPSRWRALPPARRLCCPDAGWPPARPRSSGPPLRQAPRPG